MRANWGRVIGAYEQCIRSVWPVSDYMPPVMPAFLAEMTARLSPSYYNHEDEFLSDAYAAYVQGAENAGLGSLSARELYRDAVLSSSEFYAASPRTGRRRPTPFEATVETGRRLRDIRRVERSLHTHSVAAILGGSASYGRFFNVKGGRDSSDLDILLVVEDWEQARTALSELPSLEMVEAVAVESAVARLEDMQEFSRMRENVVFSAKVPLWSDLEDPQLRGYGVDGNYLLSFHIATRTAFESLALVEADEIEVETVGAEHVFFDYRDSSPNRVDMQRAFNGRALRVDIDNMPHGRSFVRETLAFKILEGCYYPGMFQNLILPGFDIRWGDARTRNAVESFRWKLIDRLRSEQRERPDEFMRLSLAHTRSEVFAPHTVRSVDQSTRLA